MSYGKGVISLEMKGKLEMGLKFSEDVVRLTFWRLCEEVLLSKNLVKGLTF